jgi:transposase
MESTGAYWRPIYYLLEEVVECWVLNAQHLKKVPGRKTDVTDSEWIAELVAHGLVRPSFVPLRPIRKLRDLTRYRTALIQDRTRDVQRLQNVLEDAGIKLDAMVSDVMGTSSRRMLAAMIAGERDPQALAELALGRMRPKVPDLERALVGHLDDHHAGLCSKMLAHIDDLAATITKFTRIPGVNGVITMLPALSPPQAVSLDDGSRSVRTRASPATAGPLGSPLPRQSPRRKSTRKPPAGHRGAPLVT